MHEGSSTVAVTPVIRILHFQPQRVDFDSQLRERFIPILRAQAGLLDLVAGRHGPDERGPRIVVSVWAPGATVALPPWSDQGLLATDAPPTDFGTEGRLEVMPVRVQFRSDTSDRPRVLRVFRGRVRAGDLEGYVERSEAGTRADAAAGRGPLSLYLATDQGESDRFVTVSTWSDWSVIEAATGGDIRRPVATRHAERLAAAEATHFEVIEL